MTTATADQVLEQVIEIPLDRLAAHPRNVRRNLGDLTDLTRSIRDRGVEMPLVVLPADDTGTHHIVAGHRRRAAAEAAGRTSVPCLVRPFDDDADIVLAMLPENTQRSDGLNVADEARALAAVIDLRGGNVTTRRLANATGHSDNWVRTRLALLTLPDNALDALHAGTITIDIATAMTSLSEWPDLIDDLLGSDRGVTVWVVEQAQRSKLTELAVEAAANRLTAAGIIVHVEADWQANSRSWATLDSQQLDHDAHRPELCHAVVVKARYDSTVVEIPICTEPRRHRGRNADSAVRTSPEPANDRDRADTAEKRERRLAAENRSRWLTERLGGRLPATGEVLGLAVLTWIETAPYVTVQKAARALELETPGEYTDYAAVLIEYASGDARRLSSVALAVAAVTAEDRARHTMAARPVARYLDAIERWGYQPTDWEHTTRLAGTDTTSDTADVPDATAPSVEPDLPEG